MVDHSKFERSALHLFTHLEAFDEVVSSDLLDPSVAAGLRDDRVRLTLVPTRGETHRTGEERDHSQEDHQRA